MDYFKDLAEKTDLQYQSLVNYVLRDYVFHGLSPTANWESAKPKKKRA
jgi:hypothetical protein